MSDKLFEESKVGRKFRIRLNHGGWRWLNFTCVVWEGDRRSFKCDDEEGYVEMDALEYADQYALGRIEVLPEKETA